MARQPNPLSPDSKNWCGTPAATCTTSPRRTSRVDPPRIAVPRTSPAAAFLEPYSAPPVTIAARPSRTMNVRPCSSSITASPLRTSTVNNML